MTPQSKLWIKMCFLFFAVFATGSIAGAVLDGVYRTRAAAPTPSIRDGESYLRVLDGELHLSTKQSSDMRDILNQTRTEYSSLCGEVKPRYNAVRDKARQRIRALLDAEQQGRFDTMITQENCNCPDQKP
jgi:hypothetical protein